MRRMLAAAVILVALPTVVLVGCTASRTDRPELGTLLDRVVAAGAPGILVVVREGETVRSEARGFADPSRARPIHAGDRFRIGSVTKKRNPRSRKIHCSAVVGSDDFDDTRISEDFG